MHVEIAVQGSEGDLEPLRAFLASRAECKEVSLVKVDRTTMSVHDGVSFLIQSADFISPEALAALAAGIGTLLARLGHRARIRLTADGSVVGENLSSKDVVKVVEAAVAKR